MISRRDMSRRLRQVGFQLLAACLTGYFLYHAFHGDRGILAWLRLSQEIKLAKAELDQVTSERQKLERRVALLSSASLDPDLLEERARAMLNFAYPDDLLIFLDQPAKPADNSR